MVPWSSGDVPERSDEELVDELARVLREADDAKVLVRRAGLPSQHVPDFEKPLVFWTKVVRAAADGAVPGGVQAIVDAAVKRFPGNQVFAGYRSDGLAASPTVAGSSLPSSGRSTLPPAGNHVDNRGATIGQQFIVGGDATVGLPGDPSPTWRARITLALVAGAVLLAVTLTLSREARRTVCRAPGLRSVCAATGIGDVPSSEEQALWEAALATTDGEGLRRYLQVYPEGAYAEQAGVRVAACRLEREESLGPEHETRYVYESPLHPDDFATEADARSDSLAQANREAKTTCVPSAAEVKTSFVSAVVEPHRWHCTKSEGRFACRFSGNIVCRVRPRGSTQREVCQQGQPSAQDP